MVITPNYAGKRMICFDKFIDLDGEFRPRARDQRMPQPHERFRMTQGYHGRSANQILRSKRQPTISGIYRRRLKKIS